MFTSGIRAAYRSFKEDRARRHDARTLSALDDALLKDIGIARSGIEAVVAGMPYRRDR